MTVTREMLSAAHAVTIARGDVILSADLLTRIYEAMRARSYVNPARHVSYACPVCAASLEPGLDALRIACQHNMVIHTPWMPDNGHGCRLTADVAAPKMDDVVVPVDGLSIEARVDAVRDAVEQMRDQCLKKGAL